MLVIYSTTNKSTFVLIFSLFLYCCIFLNKNGENVILWSSLNQWLVCNRYKAFHLIACTFSFFLDDTRGHRLVLRPKIFSYSGSLPPKSWLRLSICTIGYICYVLPDLALKLHCGKGFKISTMLWGNECFFKLYLFTLNFYFTRCTLVFVKLFNTPYLSQRNYRIFQSRSYAPLPYPVYAFDMLD